MTPFDTPPFTVLLIDDNPDDRALTERALHAAFPTVACRHVRDAADFARLLETPDFAAAICDYQLHWADGLSLVRRLKLAYPDLPVIMFTGTGSEEIAVAGMKLGLDDYVLKEAREANRLPLALQTALARAQARRDLSASQDRYHTLFQEAPIGLFRLALGGFVTEVNPALSEMFGLPEPSAARAYRIHDVFPDDAVRVALTDDLEANQRLQGRELRLRRISGTLGWFRISLRCLYDPSGEVCGYEGTVEDITAQRQAEEALRQSEARLLTAQQIGRIGDWQVEVASGQVTWSPQMYALYQRDPRLGPPTLAQAAAYYAPADAERVIKAYHFAVEHAQPIELEVMAHLPNGATASHLTIYTPELADADADPTAPPTAPPPTAPRTLAQLAAAPEPRGQVVRIRGVTQDISERRLVLEQLRSLARFPAQNPHPVLRVSGEGMLLYANEASRPLLDHWNTRLGELLPLDWRTLVSDAMAARHLQTVELTAAERIFTVTLAPVPAEAPETPGYVNLYAMDVTARHQAEAELTRLATVVEQAAEAIVITDPSGVIDYVNPAFTSLTGYPAAEALGRRPSLLNSGRQPREFYERLWGTITNGGVWHGTLLNRRRSGEIYPEESSIFPIKDRNGKITNYATVKRDISERVQAEARAERQLERLAALRTIDMTISASLDMRVTLSVVLDQVVHHLGMDAAAILLVDPISGELNFAAGRGLQRAPLSVGGRWPDRALSGRVAHASGVVAYPDLSAAPEARAQAPLLAEEGMRAYYGLPLRAKGLVKGVLEVYARQPHQADPEWLSFLEALGGQAAIAIDNTTLYENLQRSTFDLAVAYDATLEGWSRALELRDRETQGHSHQVTETMMRLARRMGFPAEEMIHIRRGALLHDIGKMGVPDSILLKPGPLNDAEWEIMRQHPTYAHDLLAPIHFLRPALDIPYCHHERWDGSGYPRGLVGAAIPRAARAFAVVDVWHALHEDRPYRPGWSEDQITTYLQALAGIQFDPEVVAIFVQMLGEQP